MRSRQNYEPNVVGIITITDGISASYKKISELMSKEELTKEEEAELQFNINIFANCIEGGKQGERRRGLL